MPHAAGGFPASFGIVSHSAYNLVLVERRYMGPVGLFE